MGKLKITVDDAKIIRETTDSDIIIIAGVKDGKPARLVYSGRDVDDQKAAAVLADIFASAIDNFMSELIAQAAIDAGCYDGPEYLTGEEVMAIFDSEKPDNVAFKEAI